MRRKNLMKRILILLEILLILSVPMGIWILAKPGRVEAIRQRLGIYGVKPKLPSRQGQRD